MKRLILLLLFMIPVLAVGQRRYASIPATSSGPQTWNPILAADVPSNFLRSNATNTMAGNTVFSATNYGITFNMVDNDFSGVRDFVIDQQETVQNPYHSRFTLNSFSFKWQSDIGSGLDDYIFLDPFTQSFNFGYVITQESGVTRIPSLAGSGDQMVIVDNNGDLSTEAPPFDNPATTDQDLLVFDGVDFDRLGIGSDGLFLGAGSGALGYFGAWRTGGNTTTTANTTILGAGYDLEIGTAASKFGEVTVDLSGDMIVNAGGGFSFVAAGASSNAGFQTASGLLVLQADGDISVNGGSGTSGQVLTSAGSGAPATWEDATGGGGVPQVYRTGNYYSYNVNQVTLTTQALAAGTLRAFPFKVEAAVSFDEVKAEVSTSVGGSTVRFCLYTDNGSGYPDALVANSDTGDLSSASNAVITTGTLGTPISLTAGHYWVAANSTHTPTMRSFNFIAMPPFMGLHGILGSGNQPTGWTVASTYGACPSNYPGGATAATVIGPAVIFRVP